jgi:hypothetical protein
MKQELGAHAVVVVALAVGLLLASQSIAYASGASVSGGGIVGGDLGTTSQLGFNASSSGGEFLCVMAGRSGGFPFGPWDSITQMRVQGPVDAGSLSISGGVASFSGTAMIHVVGRTGTGDVLTATVTVFFTSRQTAGGAGVATHRLEVTFQDGSQVSFPKGLGAMEPLRSGHITISQ